MSLMSHRCWVLFFVFAGSLLSDLPAQVPKEQAWTVLQRGAKEQDAKLRVQAVRALGVILDDEESKKLAINALSDQEVDVRIAAATALGHMNAKDAVPMLKDALKDQNVGVILAATSSLRMLGDPSAYLVYYALLTGERKSGEGLMAEQKKMLSDPKKMAQFGFEQGIGFVPFAGMGYGALKALTKDDKSPVRAAAATALAADPDEKSGKALLAAASDDSWIVRVAALDALARRKDPSVVPDIVQLLHDIKPQVRYTAAAAIYYLSSSKDSE